MQVKWKSSVVDATVLLSGLAAGSCYRAASTLSSWVVFIGSCPVKWSVVYLYLQNVLHQYEGRPLVLCRSDAIEQFPRGACIGGIAFEITHRMRRAAEEMVLKLTTLRSGTHYKTSESGAPDDMQSRSVHGSSGKSCNQSV